MPSCVISSTLPTSSTGSQSTRCCQCMLSAFETWPCGTSNGKPSAQSSSGTTVSLFCSQVNKGTPLSTVQSISSSSWDTTTKQMSHRCSLTLARWTCHLPPVADFPLDADDPPNNVSNKFA
uniref:(northern house mosquito) hypothetical protein n=1 Tax=Culex pipiens TaxID=7175 RepID=A0A8D8AN00_CULPI